MLAVEIATLLVTLQLATLGISVVNARQLGTDEVARKKAQRALNVARRNAGRINRAHGLEHCDVEDGQAEEVDPVGGSD